ncbi:MAG: iron-containing alcohol dehydrogenase [Erysipelotrichaceae bacterium]|nr:iron-containing alcohol dehydrogenase [Erysipelotrichaceae bacterium]
MALERYSIKMPKAVYSGTDSLDNVTAIIRSLRSRKVAAFTDKGIRKLGLFDLVERRIREAGVDYEIFDDLPAEPTYMAVQNVIDQFKNTGCDLIVACGGGSVMDAAKLASVLVTDEYTVKDLLDDPSKALKCVPIVMIPTTAGTGAECTPNAIVGVPERELKIGIVNDNMISDYVILDAELIRNLPRSIAAATGVDAMCHAIECFTSNKANPFSDCFALEAFDLIMNNIEQACDDKTALQAKNRMQIAAFYGGVAITASGTTAVHALSYPLGGKYHIAHGVSNAMLLIPVMKFNEPVIRPLLAKAWDRAYHGDKVLGSDEEKSKALVDWMESIVRHLEIPTDLKQFGVDPADLDSLVEAGMSVQRLLVNNMREVKAEDARKIYQEVLK